MLLFRWRVARGVGWGVSWFLLELLQCHLVKGIMSLCLKTSRMLICQLCHTVKAEQTRFDPLSTPDRPQSWNCSCFSTMRYQTSKLNLFIVDVSSARPLIRLSQTEFAVKYEPCVIINDDAWFIFVLCVLTFITTLNTHKELNPFIALRWQQWSLTPSSCHGFSSDVNALINCAIPVLECLMHCSQQFVLSFFVKVVPSLSGK